MTKGLKIFLIICAVFIGGGMLLAGAGFLMGGHIYLDAFDDDGGVVSFGNLKGSIAHHSERGRNPGALQEVSQNTQAFDSVEIETGSYNIAFVQADDYGVYVKYYENMGEPDVRIEQGVLKVTDTKYGFSFNKANDKTQALIEVHYPENLTLREVDLDCAVGVVDLSGVNARIISGDLSVGEITGNQVICTDALDLESEVGAVQLSGTFTGEIDIACEIGDVVLNTTLGKDQYRAELDSTVGEVCVDGASVTGSYSQYQGANRMEIDCSMGRIAVNFGAGNSPAGNNDPAGSSQMQNPASGAAPTILPGHHPEPEYNHNQGQHI